MYTTIDQLTYHAVKAAQDQNDVRSPGNGETDHRPNSGPDDRHLPEKQRLPRAREMRRA